MLTAPAQELQRTASWLSAASFFAGIDNDLVALFFGHQKSPEPVAVLRDRDVPHPLAGGQQKHSPEQIGLVKAVMDPPALLPVFDKSRILQHAQVERDFRLCQVEGGNDIAHAELAFVQKFYDPEPRLIGKGLEYGDQLVHCVLPPSCIRTQLRLPP